MKIKVFCFKMNSFSGSPVFTHKKRSSGRIFYLDKFESCNEHPLRFLPVILPAREEKDAKVTTSSYFVIHCYAPNPSQDLMVLSHIRHLFCSQIGSLGGVWDGQLTVCISCSSGGD